MSSVDYIVIHSTGVKDVDAQGFYDRFNMETERKASAHFVIDDKEVIQCLPTNMVAWAVGKKEDAKIPCYNTNSISVEICEFNEPIKQQQAIDNAIDFVNNVLEPQFDAEIVPHSSVKATLCPSIMTDEEFDNYFK